MLLPRSLEELMKQCPSIQGNSWALITLANIGGWILGCVCALLWAKPCAVGVWYQHFGIVAVSVLEMSRAVSLLPEPGVETDLLCEGPGGLWAS